MFGLFSGHGSSLPSKDEAEALADDLRGAIRRGEYPPPRAPAPTSTPSEITFAKFGALWLERERQDRVGDWKSDRSRLARLGAITLDGGALGDRPIGRITADDFELTFRTLAAEGLAGQTLNEYLQTCQHLQRWGARKGYLQRSWFDAGKTGRTRSGRLYGAPGGSRRTCSTTRAS